MSDTPEAMKPIRRMLEELQKECEQACSGECVGSDGGCFPCKVWLDVDEALSELDELDEKVGEVLVAAQGLA